VSAASSLVPRDAHSSKWTSNSRGGMLLAEKESRRKDSVSLRDYFDARYQTGIGRNSKFFESIASRGLARFLAERCGGKILVDVGCGAGGFADAAAAYFVVYAFDISEQAVKTTPDSIRGKWIGTGDAMPIRSDSVDMVTLLDVVEHLADPQPCIEEANRILRVGGFLFVRTPNPDSVGLRMKGRNWFGLRDPTHVSIGNADHWAQCLEKSGFVIREWGTNLLADPPYISESYNFPEKVFFQVTNLVGMLVKPYLPWGLGENIHLLARKTRSN